jgi:hypothetical protein
MKKIILLAVVSAVIFNSCKKKDSFNPDAGSSYSTVDNLFKDVNKTISDAAAENNISGKTDGVGGTTNLCATVTLSPNDLITFPKTVTVDFGTGCTDAYGVTRKGKFTALFTGYLHTAGSHVHVTFDSYYVNEVKLEGVYDLANTSPNSSSRTFADTITNGKATTPDSKVCTWNATRSSVQTGGFSTVSILDDEYTGQGQSSGVGFNGVNFTATSTNILWKLACRYLVSGTVTIYSGTDPIPVIVDFGNGTCDANYTVSYSIYSIPLVFWY